MLEILYPPLSPYDQGFLNVGDPHRIYYEQCGRPDGIPVVFIHGGPGAGSGESARRFFDPEIYRIIVFDQRGAGRSTPLGCLQDNTTPHLIADMEQLRKHLDIERWMLFGGSWGSTLAIAYAQHHPKRCLAMILRGIFLCRPQEIDWFLYGMRTIFPEAWQEFSHFIPEEERHDLLRAYYQRLKDDDPNIHMPAAVSWSRYEGICATLLPSPETVAVFEDKDFALGLARLEAHYFSHDIFLPPNNLMENIDTIRAIPTTIVQGRYDIVCPIITADELAAQWPEAEYIVVDDGGHSAFDPSILRALLQACERMKVRLQ